MTTIPTNIHKKPSERTQRMLMGSLFFNNNEHKEDLAEKDGLKPTETSQPRDGGTIHHKQNTNPFRLFFSLFAAWWCRPKGLRQTQSRRRRTTLHVLFHSLNRLVSSKLNHGKRRTLSDVSHVNIIPPPFSQKYLSISREIRQIRTLRL